ncbi:restriction endonuclease subunit S [Pannonibacter sp. Pt2-lr]
MSGLPKGWATTDLGAIGEVYCGQSSTASDVNGEGRGTPYVTGPEQWTGSEIELNKWTTTPKRTVPEGCIFITVKGAGVGKMFPGVACAIGRDVYAYEPSKQLLYPFVMRALANTVNAVIREARGDIPGLSKEHITDHTVPLPPLAEQKRIVAKLEALNAKSARARTELTRIETLVSRYKQAVLSKAFSGELVTSQRSIPTARVEVREMLSELAQGWSPKCDKISASSDQQWAVITTTAIQPFSFQPNENKVLPTNLLPREHLVIEEGDVLITRAGPRVRCGVCCYVETTRPRLMLCDKAYRLRLKDLCDPKFLCS